MSKTLKLDGNMTRKVVNRIRKWMPKSLICAEAGISMTTFDRWMLRGQSGEQPFDQFYEAVTAAYADRVQEAVDNVRQERGGYKWLLERMHREEFGPTQQVEVRHKALQGQIYDAEVLTAEVDALLLGEGNEEKEDNGTGE